MRKTISVTIEKHFEEFIADLVEAGDYESESEVINAGLQLLEEYVEEQQEKLEWLRKHVAEGIAEADRGEFSDGKQFMADLRAGKFD